MPAPRDVPAGRSFLSERGRALAYAAGLGLLVLLVYGQVLGHAFVEWDDANFIVRNPDHNPPRLASIGRLWTDLRADETRFFVPVLYTVWILVAGVAYQPADAAGPAGAATVPLAAWPFHLLSVAAHLASVLLVFALLRRLGRRDGPLSRPAVVWPAFVGAAVFALHPLQVEAVAWASTVYTPLSAALGLGALWHYLRFGDLLAARSAGGVAAVPAWRPWVRYALATLLFALSLLTKPSMVVLPAVAGAVVLLLPSVRPRGRALAILLVALVPWLAMGLGVAFGTSQYRQSADTVFRPPVPDRLLVAADAVGFYLRKLLLPIGLTPDYGRTPQRVVADPGTWAWGAAAVAVLSFVALATVRRAPWVAAGWAVFVAGAAATLGLVPFEYQIYSTVADRYAYLSMFGTAVAVAFGLTALTDRPSPPARRAAKPRVSRPAVYAGAAVVLLLLGALSAFQAARWRDTITLFEHGLAVNPDSEAAHQSMLFALDQQGRPGEALAHARHLVESRPTREKNWRFLGYVLKRLRRWDEAAASYRRAAELPGGQPDDAYDGMATALAQGGEPAEAERAFRQAIALNPRNASVHRNLASFYLNQNRLDDAIGEFEAALALDPESPLLRRAVADLKARRPAGGSAGSR